MKFRSLVIKILFILYSTTALSLPSHEDIYSAADDFLKNHLTNLINAANYSRYEYETGKLDPRLNLSSCENELTVKLLSDPVKSTRNTLKVSCASNWNVILTTKITLFKPVIVSAQTINRNSPLDPSLLTLEEMPVIKLRYGHYNSLKELKNHIAKRNIAGGQIITPYNIQGASLIKRGDNVVIIAKSDILKVKMSGEAMSDGRFGQQIPVKNLSSNRMVKGIVFERGMVEVPL